MCSWMDHSNHSEPWSSHVHPSSHFEKLTQPSKFTTRKSQFAKSFVRIARPGWLKGNSLSFLGSLRLKNATFTGSPSLYLGVKFVALTIQSVFTSSSHFGQVTGKSMQENIPLPSKNDTSCLHFFNLLPCFSHFAATETGCRLPSWYGSTSLQRLPFMIITEKWFAKWEPITLKSLVTVLWSEPEIKIKYMHNENNKMMQFSLMEYEESKWL